MCSDCYMTCRIYVFQVAYSDFLKTIFFLFIASYRYEINKSQENGFLIDFSGTIRGINMLESCLFEKTIGSRGQSQVCDSRGLTNTPVNLEEQIR